MLKTKFFIGLLAGLMAIIVVPLCANAETVYVHPTQGDYQTIQAAVDGAVIGDTILVGPGSYESFIVSKNHTIISEEGPDKTAISSGGTVTFQIDADRSSISGFTITSLGGYGIKVNQGCFYVEIKNNIISGCAGHGIYLDCNSSDIKYTAIINNTISYNGGSGIFIYHSGGSGTAVFSDNLVSNNIINHNAGYGIRRNVGNYTSYTNNQYNNNCLYGNTEGDSNDYVTVDTVHWNLFIDPLFMETDTSDFHLQSSSECIDAGQVSSVYNDPDGTRNDMGVYGGPGAATFWPYPAGGPVVTDLSVTPPSVQVGGTLTLKATGKIQ